MNICTWFTQKITNNFIDFSGNETTNDMYHENTMLSKENSNLRTRIKAMQETIEHLTAKNSQLLADKELGGWIKDGSKDADNDITGEKNQLFVYQM